MTGTPHIALPKPRPVSRRGLTIAAVVLLGFFLLYALVVRAYQVEGELSTTQEQIAQAVDVEVTVEPFDFDARTNVLTARLRFVVVNPVLTDSGGRLNEGIRVTVSGADGSEEFRFAEGEPVGNAEVQVGTSGEIYAYPFDTHEAFMALSVETFEREAGGINQTTGELTSSIDVQGAISGWDIKADLSSLGNFPLADLTLKRAFSTQAFAIVLILMAISVVVLALIASLMTVTNRRKFEVALLTWNGAILFALPLLRTYLPGSPPIGAAMDIYLYLWTFVLAVSSLVLMVVAWSEQRKAEIIIEHEQLHGARHGA
ncbi:MAG: DUF4436 family protein [Actinomycetota bacterium]|nr:DUF4436 family protein [Actinomycetota bacterium]